MAELLITKLTDTQHRYLREIGLSKDCVALYELLLKNGQLTARQASSYSEQFSAAQYRLFYALEAAGLVRRLGGWPRQFVALPLTVALPAALTIKQQALQLLLTQSLTQPASASGTAQVRLVLGREALYSEYMRLAEGAQREICVYAIGIAYSDGLVTVQKAARKRGVRVRHAIQQFKPSNYHVIHAWRRLGVDVRHYPAERGFHVMLFDEQWALISFSDPTNTDDRISLLTDNKQAVRLFKGYFNEIWGLAKEITV